MLYSMGNVVGRRQGKARYVQEEISHYFDGGVSQ